ncbi:NKAP domain containing 1 [Osmerus eperlanus]|uniref:NKAP domain containing 1 n=1 Tax=Osmerus eperlanus TaxID=29151 RepID=UPI002E0EECDB
MAREPMGKVLLRNVIRHTDAHNKIQEESEMWKMRDMEKTSCHKQMPVMDGNRGHMHCDRIGSESRARSGSQERSSGQNEREARYWTRKLYEFEAKDPDRWGHSGFKELYPEEFRIEGEGGAGDKNNKHRKKKKSKFTSETDRSKSSKKSSKKKKKKKKRRDGKRKSADASGNESRDEGSADETKKQKRKSSKSKPRRERSRGREEESSSEDSDGEGEGRGRTQIHGKRQRNSDRGPQPGLETHKKRRKNWKAPNEERSEGSSDE